MRIIIINSYFLAKPPNLLIYISNSMGMGIHPYKKRFTRTAKHTHQELTQTLALNIAFSLF